MHVPATNTSQDLEAQQAQDRAGNEANFTQARQELIARWQEHMSALQEQLLQTQQQMMARHEEETAIMLVSATVMSAAGRQTDRADRAAAEPAPCLQHTAQQSS